ncbi:MAG: hypothetical protein UY78_C0033G0002, partial [Parcubacteria group bacterium GW2011_GWA1_53_13]
VKTGTLSGPNKRGLSVKMPPMSIASVFVMVDGTVLGASTTQNPSFIESIRTSFSNALGMVASVLQSLLQTAK